MILCKELIKRNGYFTGKRCSREATTVVTFSAGGLEPDVERVCCTQHANLLVVNNWWREVARRPIGKELPTTVVKDWTRPDVDVCKDVRGVWWVTLDGVKVSDHRTHDAARIAARRHGAVGPTGPTP